MLSFPSESTDGTAAPTLSIVVPVYRSEGCLDALAAAIEEALAPPGLSYELVLVNDGSPDDSWRVIEALSRARENIVGVDLRRNFGQDNAILTGLRVARGRYVAIMDDDLQHHPRDLPALLAKAQAGADVVYADFREKRQKLWKNLGSWFNGKVAEWVIGKPKHIYLSPYKIIRREVAVLVCRYDGPYPYLDGLLFQVTSRIEQVSVEHHDRFAGSSNYNLLKSIRVWTRLATSFSVRPLRLVAWCGFVLAVLGALLAVWVVLYRLLVPENFSAQAVGWSSLMVTLLVIGGVQMIFLGILGEYMGRSYLTICRRPQTAIREVLNAGPRRDQPVPEHHVTIEQGR